MLKDLINTIPTSRGMNSCDDRHPRLDTRHFSPLLVGIVYISFRISRKD